MRSILTYLLLIFWHFSTLGALAMEIDILVDKSKEIEKSCQEYAKELRMAAELDSTGAKFKDRKSVEVVLKIFDPRKGESPAYRQILSDIIKKLPNITDKDLVSVFYEAVPCNSVVAEYSALKGVLGSIRGYKLSKGTEEKGRQVTQDYLMRRANSPGTLIEQMVQISLVKKLSDDGFLKLDKTQMDQISFLKDEAETTKKQLTSKNQNEDKWPDSGEAFYKLEEGQRKRFVDKFRVELQKTEKLRSRLHRLYKELGLERGIGFGEGEQ